MGGREGRGGTQKSERERWWSVVVPEEDEACMMQDTGLCNQKERERERHRGRRKRERQNEGEADMQATEERGNTPTSVT